MEEQEERRIIIKAKKCFVDHSPDEYDVNKKIKTESDNDNVCSNVQIKHEVDMEVKQESERFESTSDIESFRDTEDSLVTSNFNSPESLCEVSLEEQYYRCPYCSFETTLKKYMKIHLASKMHLFTTFNSNKMFDRYDQDYETIAATTCAGRMTASKFFSSDPLCEASLEEKFCSCPHCPYGTNVNIANEIHLLTRRSSETSSESIFDDYKRASDKISTAKSLYYDLETLPPQRIIPHILLCKICGYEATSSRALSKHTEKEHRPLLKYPEISYEACSPHKRPRSKLNVEEGSNCRSKYSRIEKVVCDVCAYHAKDGIDLKVHKLKHRDVSELLRHKCAYCDGNSKKSCQIRKNKYTRGKVEFADSNLC